MLFGRFDGAFYVVVDALGRGAYKAREGMSKLPPYTSNNPQRLHALPRVLRQRSFCPSFPLKTHRVKLSSFVQIIIIKTTEGLDAQSDLIALEKRNHILLKLIKINLQNVVISFGWLLYILSL